MIHSTKSVFQIKEWGDKWLLFDFNFINNVSHLSGVLKSTCHLWKKAFLNSMYSNDRTRLFPVSRDFP